jgi:hypothetical protein
LFPCSHPENRFRKREVEGMSTAVYLHEMLMLLFGKYNLSYLQLHFVRNNHNSEQPIALDIDFEMYDLSMVCCSEFLATDPVVPGSIPGATIFSEK